MPSSLEFMLNSERVQTNMPPGALLLDFIRSKRNLTGAKPACREGDCGACLVLLGKWHGGRVVYQPVNSCLLPLGAAAGCHVATIEGINSAVLNPIQHALVANGAIQCGFCTPGLVIALTAFFLSGTDSDYAAGLDAAAGNLCRCACYAGIKRALQQLCRDYDLGQAPQEGRLAKLVEWRILPEYFLTIHDALADFPSAIEPVGGVLVAGGTDLFVQRPAILRTQQLHFVERDSELHGISREGERCVVGAAVSVEALRSSALMRQLFPAIHDDFKLICSAPVRQRATVGGNLINASPIGDLSVFFLALDAQAHLQAADGQRSLPLRGFFKAYKRVDLQAGERLRALSFACPENLLLSFEKVAKRMYLDIASVNSALSLTHGGGIITSAHLALGGVAPIPLYLQTTSQWLEGQPLNAATLCEAAVIMQKEIAPIDDIRGSAAYKRLLSRQLLYAHFLKLFPRAIRWEDLHASD